MRTTLDRIVTGMFAAAMGIFLLLAIALVLLQLVGVVTVQPALVVTAETWLKSPSILAAVAVAILGYVLFNVRGEQPSDG